MSALEELLDDVAADEAGRARHERLQRSSSPAGARRRSSSADKGGPKASRYQRRYFGIHWASLKFETPVSRSSQIVGISATGRRRRRALTVSSRPTSKP